MLVYQRVSVHYAWNTDTPAVGSKRISCRRLKMGHTQFHGKKTWNFPLRRTLFCIPEKKNPTNCVIPIWNAEHIYMTYPIKSRCSIVNSHRWGLKRNTFWWRPQTSCKRSRRRLSCPCQMRFAWQATTCRRGVVCLKIRCPIHCEMGMDQYLLIPFLGGWTSIYQLFWCSPGVQGFDTLWNHHCQYQLVIFLGVPHFQTHPYDGLSWWPHLLFFL